MSSETALFAHMLMELAQVELDEWAESKGLEAQAMEDRFLVEDLDCPGLNRDYDSLVAVRAKAKRTLWKAHRDEKKVVKQVLKDRVHSLCATWGPHIERATARQARFQSGIGSPHSRYLIGTVAGACL